MSSVDKVKPESSEKNSLSEVSDSTFINDAQAILVRKDRNISRTAQSALS